MQYNAKTVLRLISNETLARLFAPYQDLDIQAARQALVEQTRLTQNASQALQNAVETANLVSKQAVRHGDIASRIFAPLSYGPILGELPNSVSYLHCLAEVSGVVFQ